MQLHILTSEEKALLREIKDKVQVRNSDLGEQGRYAETYECPWCLSWKISGKFSSGIFSQPYDTVEHHPDCQLSNVNALLDKVISLGTVDVQFHFEP